VIVAVEANRLLVLDTTLTQDDAARLRVGQPVEVVVAETGARASGAAVRLVLRRSTPEPAASRWRSPSRTSTPVAPARLRPGDLSRWPEQDAWKVPVAALVQREGAVAPGWPVPRGAPARSR